MFRDHFDTRPHRLYFINVNGIFTISQPNGSHKFHHSALCLDNPSTWKQVLYILTIYVTFTGGLQFVTS